MTGKVLVIDDDVWLHRLVIDHIKLRGDNADDVVFASGGEIGIEKFIEIHPLCTFIDMKLPSMNGAETFDKIKAYDPSARIIIMAGVASYDCISDAIERGADAYLCKNRAGYLSLITDLIMSVLKNV